MNKFSKVVSLALVLVLAISVLVIPASAATPCTAEAKVVAEYQGKTSGGYDYYKFSVYLNSSHSLNAYQLNISWDNAVWTKLRATTLADFANFNVNVIDRTDTNNIMYNTCDAYLTYGLDGEMGQWDSEDGSYWGYMPYDGNKPTFAKISDTNLGDELVAAGYTGFYSAWAGDFGDHYLCISGGTINGAGSPVAGEVMVLSWYMRLNEGVAPGDYEVGFNAKQAYQLTAQYCLEDAVTTKECSDQLADIPAANISYTNAIVTVEEDTIVNPLKGQMRYGDVVEGAQTYDVRALATITAADFNATFTDEATAKEMIDEIGFVFAAGSNVGTPDMTGVKALVENGTALDGYTKKTVNYLSSGVEADNYVFSCIVTGISETDAQADSLVAVGYIKWTDGEGTHYNYYPQAQTISYATLYNSKPAQA